LGLDYIVRFHPSTPRARDYLDAFDVFVHTSSFEGLPMVVIEAMAAGVPIVAQAAGGTAEVVRDQETGRLVSVGDVPQLAMAIEELLTDRARAERLARAGRGFVIAEHDATRRNRAIEDIYRSMLGRLDADANRIGPIRSILTSLKPDRPNSADTARRV
jgi:glycosyltransferase involved in cell wall biosynthesis